MLIKNFPVLLKLERLWPSTHLPTPYGSITSLLEDYSTNNHHFAMIIEIMKGFKNTTLDVSHYILEKELFSVFRKWVKNNLLEGLKKARISTKIKTYRSVYYYLLKFAIIKKYSEDSILDDSFFQKYDVIHDPKNQIRDDDFINQGVKTLLQLSFNRGKIIHANQLELFHG